MTYFRVYSLLTVVLLLQNSKLALYNAFLKANLGKWLKKPIEQDQFETFEAGDVYPATTV